ncbi:MAG: phosphatidylcholine/phosphatidylserine synthase [Planctomycetes bacterium]|nr:phosphatidylcholine/phosphatidylserine synthase [Planctomycetota bacterium]
MSEKLATVRSRMRRLKTLPVLPTILTAGNLASGITAILCAAHYEKQAHPWMLEMGAIMIFVAMICDMLDGKVARMTKTDGPFGAELDSLSDVVSFGVAPAILVHRLVLGEPGVFDHGQRLLWFITVFFPVMAAIRLARYNVEHTDVPVPYFRGIPSPGAAAVVCSWIIFHQEVLQPPNSALGYRYDGLQTLDMWRWVIIGLTMASALLMVSTVRYPHVGQTLLGRLGFRQMIVGILLVSLLIWKPPYFLVIATTGYLLLGLGGEAMAMWRKWRLGRSLIEDADEDEAEDAGVIGEKHHDTGPAPGR